MYLNEIEKIIEYKTLTHDIRNKSYKTVICPLQPTLLIQAVLEYMNNKTVMSYNSSLIIIQNIYFAWPNQSL